MKPYEEAKKLIQSSWIEEIKNPFGTNRMLSSSPETFLASVKINESIRKINKSDHATLFNIMTSEINRVPYFNYPKKQKQESPKLTAKICSTFGVNKYHAKQIIKIFESKGHEPYKLFGLKKGE